MEIRIILCDLTYTQQTISSDVMPAAVGNIGAYIKANITSDIDLKIFKYPEDLAKYLEYLDKERLPLHIVGFSNYVWNSNLSIEFAKLIKKKFVDSIIVFGGPNLPTDQGEQESFLRKNRVVDFHIVKEGEKAFHSLVESLIVSNFDKTKIDCDIPSLIFIGENDLFNASYKVERTLNLEEIPSPYLTGLMDEYFDGKLLPIIQTNRGCPFMCTFCTEGMNYWNKVYKNSQKKVDEEIYYIAKQMDSIGHNKRSDLHIADSNFGMYKQDLDTAKTLSQVQDKYNYPKYINVATGKNKKERVLEVAKIVNGAMKLAGSVQSLDADVLTHIKRSNISADQIIELAKNADEVGANSYSEVILGLPGDSFQSHFDTIEILVDAGFNTISMYQFMILPGTESGSSVTRDKFGMTTRWRLLPRCYGYFDVLGEEINVAETEEICVANNTLNFDDYLNCRKMNLIVNLFFNDGVFRELIQFLKLEGIPIWKWLLHIYNDMDDLEGWGTLLAYFLEETQQELWSDREALLETIDDREGISQYIDGQLGGNLMFKYKGLSMTHYLKPVADVARKAAHKVLSAYGKRTDDKEEFVNEIVKYNECRMEGIFVYNPKNISHAFSYDILSFSNEEIVGDISKYAYSKPVQVEFGFDSKQRIELNNYMKLFGNSEHGISRILSRVYIRKLFRNVVKDDNNTSEDDASLAIGQATLSGLNEFGA